MTGPDVMVKTVPGVCVDNLPLRFGSAYDASIVYDGPAEELTFQTKDAAGFLIDRVALRAGINNPSLVVNDPGADMDVRLEGDNDANLLFLDASVDRVGIGTATPGSKLTVNGALAFTTLGAAADLNSQALTNANIDSGTVDGAVIGGGSAAAITGTTIAGTDATDATSTTAAAMKTAGGLAVVKKTYLGDRLHVVVGDAEEINPSGVAPRARRFVGDKYSIADNVATGFLRITVPNEFNAFLLRIRWIAQHLGPNSRMQTGIVHVAGGRNNGVVTATAIAEQGTQLGANVEGAATITVTFSMSAVTGANSATQTVDVQIIGDTSANVTFNMSYAVEHLDMYGNGSSSSGRVTLSAL